MKLLLIIAIALAVSGCGRIQRSWTGWTGGLTTKCTEVGTTVIQSDSGIAMLLDKEGKPVPCSP